MKNKITTPIILGIATFVVVAGIFVYSQINKLKNFTLKFHKIKDFKASLSAITFDLYMKFTNNSDIQIALVEQNYKIYLNGTFVTNLSSKDKQVIAPKGDSILKVGVNITAARLGILLGSMSLQELGKIKQQKLRVDSEIKYDRNGKTLSFSTSSEDTIQKWIEE